jgi:hypothetical protein
VGSSASGVWVSSSASRPININRPEACSRSRYASATTSYSTLPSSPTVDLQLPGLAQGSRVQN